MAAIDADAELPQPAAVPFAQLQHRREVLAERQRDVAGDEPEVREVREEHRAPAPRVQP